MAIAASAHRPAGRDDELFASADEPFARNKALSQCKTMKV